MGIGAGHRSPWYYVALFACLGFTSIVDRTVLAMLIEPMKADLHISDVQAGLLIGPLLLSPFGLPVPEPTLQAHTRNFPLRLFPLELSLRNIPGYERIGAGGPRGLRMVGRPTPASTAGRGRRCGRRWAARYLPGCRPRAAEYAAW